MPLSATAQHALSTLCSADGSSATDALEKLLDSGELAASAADALPYLLAAGRLGASPALVLNATWKALCRLVSRPSASSAAASKLQQQQQQPIPDALAVSVYRFALEELRACLFSHEWTNPDSVKLSRYGCTQVALLIRANAPLAVAAGAGSELVELYHDVNFRIACGSWRGCVAAVSIVSLKLGSAIGSICGCSAVPHAYRLELLARCSQLSPQPRSAGAAAADGGGSSSDAAALAVWHSRVAAVSSCLCCLSTFREVDAASASIVESAQLLRVLLLWLPNMASALGVLPQGDASASASSQSLPQTAAGGAASAQAEELYRVVAASAAGMPALVFASSLTFAESRVSAQEEGYTSKWLGAVRRLFTAQPQLAATDSVHMLLLAALTVQHAVSLELVEGVWLMLVSSSCLSSHQGDLRSLRLRLLTQLLTAGIRCRGAEGAVPRQLAVSTARIVRSLWKLASGGWAEWKVPLARILLEHLRDSDAGIRRGAHMQAARCQLYHGLLGADVLPPVLSLLSDDPLPGEVETFGHAAAQMARDQRLSLLAAAASAMRSGAGVASWKIVTCVAILLECEQCTPQMAVGPVFEAACACALNGIATDGGNYGLLAQRFPVLVKLLQSGSVAVDPSYFHAQPPGHGKMQAFKGLLEAVFKFATAPATAGGSSQGGHVLHFAMVANLLHFISMHAALDLAALLSTNALAALRRRLALDETGAGATKQAPFELLHPQRSPRPAAPVSLGTKGAASEAGALPRSPQTPQSSNSFRPKTSTLQPAPQAAVAAASLLSRALQDFEVALLPFWQEASAETCSGAAGSTMTAPAQLLRSLQHAHHSTSVRSGGASMCGEAVAVSLARVHAMLANVLDAAASKSDATMGDVGGEYPDSRPTEAAVNHTSAGTASSPIVL